MIRRDAYRSMNSINALDAVCMELTELGYPKISSSEIVPNKLLPFDKAKRSSQTDAWIHFFIEDYQFERIWVKPNSYVEMLSKYEGIISPDFSVYYDMPTPMKRWNIYRNKFLARYMQDRGINVIPNIQIMEQELWDDAISGVEPNGVIAVNCIGTKRRYFARQMAKCQMEYIKEKLSPKTIICYANENIFNEYDNVIYFENNHIKRIRDVQRSRTASQLR